MNLILPENYDPRLGVRQTQEAIKYIRDTFQKEFGKEMNLERISAPLFVEKSSGLNDTLMVSNARFLLTWLPSLARLSKLSTLLPNGNVWLFTSTASSQGKDFTQT